MDFDVFFYEAFAEEQSALAARLGNGLRVGYSAETIQRSGHATPPAPLISIRTQSVIPDSWHPPVRGVLARATGYDHLLPVRARQNPPALACLPEYCSRAVAEQAALLWMALLRKLPMQLQQWPRFKRDNLTGGENLGRSLLVAGVGQIGHEVVRLGQGLGLRVRGTDPIHRYDDVEYVSLEDGVRGADIIAACMNLTQENRGLFNYALLRTARKGCLFINVARGELAASADIERLLDEGILGGVAFDVFDGESVIADALRENTLHPEADRLRNLAGRPNVIMTPHNAFNTREALARKADYSVRQILSFMKYGQFEWPLPT